MCVVIIQIKNMAANDETHLFNCGFSEDVKTKLEFACVAVRMYKYEGEVVCDFCLSTYSYAKSIDTVSLVVDLRAEPLG